MKKKILGIFLTALFFSAVLGAAYREQVAEVLAYHLHLAPMALALYPDANFAFEIGNYYFNAKGSGVYDLDKAERYFRKSLTLDPSTPAAWHQLARIDFLRGNFDAALSEINTQIEFHGDALIASYYVRGLIEGFQKNYSAAEKDFQTFLRMKPETWGVYNDLAWVYFQAGDFSRAEAIARRGLSVAPASPWLLTSLGVALLNLGRREEAAEVLQKAFDGAQSLTPADWGAVNPGNDPRTASGGLEKMKAAILENLNLALIHAPR